MVRCLWGRLLGVLGVGKVVGEGVEGGVAGGYGGGGTREGAGRLGTIVRSLRTL